MIIISIESKKLQENTN